jgi:hypothetical protein
MLWPCGILAASYALFQETAMKKLTSMAMTVAGLLVAGQAAAQIVIFEREDFVGRSVATTAQVRNFAGRGFNDRASSIEVIRDRWQVYERTNCRGHCVVLTPGPYPSLVAMGLNDRISSARIVRENERIAEGDYGGIPVAAYPYRRGRDESLIEADVTSVRAVVGAPEQRCWIEREQVPQERSGATVPAAIALAAAADTRSR